MGTIDDIQVWGNPTLEDEIVEECPVDTVTVHAAGGATNVKAGESLTFSASVTKNGQPSVNQNVTWALTGNNSTNTNISADGLLSVASEETAPSLTIEATSKYVTTKKGTATVRVIPSAQAAAIRTINGIEAGSTSTVTIDGVEFYVITKDTTNNRAMLWTKDIQGEKKKFGSSNKWRDSPIHAYLNGSWLNDKPTLKAMLVETTIKTREAHNLDNFITTTDKVFLLSEADVFGTFNSGTARPDDYTYNGQLQVANQKKIGSYYWLRSPSLSANYVALVVNGWRPQELLLRGRLWGSPCFVGESGIINQ